VAAVAWLGIFGYVVVHAALSARYGGEASAFSHVFRSSPEFVVTWIIATPFILWSAVRYPLVTDRWARHLAVHAASATVFIVATNVAWCVVEHRAQWAECTARDILAVFHIAFLVYLLIVALGQLGVWAAERREHRAQLAEVQLRALQTQLQPHFLYNTLNTVSALVLTNRNAEAVEVIHRLGELLRRLLSPSDDHEIPVAEEMRFIEEYLGVERVRFSDRLRVCCTVEPDVGSALVPRFILVPIVENAIRHGIAPLAHGGGIDVTVSQARDRVRLQVVDDGVGFRQAGSRGFGTGLENTRRRLAHLYGDRGVLLVRPVEGGGTDVVIELPYHV
jgi:two-component system, LytTR family, sensor kinase